VASSRVEAGRRRGSRPVDDRNNGGMKKFYAALAVIGVVGAAAIAYMATNTGDSVVVLDPDLPPGTAQGYVMGLPDARVEITEYADFECPACGDFAAITEPDVRKRLVEAGIARFVFVDHPLTSLHPNALSAHVAAGCADEQGKFWEMHDKLFEHQPDWSSQRSSNPRKLFEGYARESGVDLDAWGECYDERRPLPRIMANYDAGRALGVTGTPTFRVGNRLIRVQATYDNLKMYVDSAIAELPRDSVGQICVMRDGKCIGG
jgi:protein-disulfide isomerase